MAASRGISRAVKSRGMATSSNRTVNDSESPIATVSKRFLHQVLRAFFLLLVEHFAEGGQDALHHACDAFGIRMHPVFQKQ